MITTTILGKDQVMFVVTGGGSGIGQALALELAERGQDVCIVGRREAALRETAKHSPLISSFCADIASPIDRLRFVEYLQRFQQLQGLIHNAGVIDPIAPLREITEAAWLHTLNTNLTAPLCLTQACFDKLKHGRVLHIGSGASHFPVASWAAYCVSKAGLAMLTRCWQMEYPQLACASVMPGIVDTDMQACIRQSEPMDKTKHHFFIQLKQNEQLLTPGTVAKFLAWLLLEVSARRYVSQEWDIYDNRHHHEWLQPPYCVPQLPLE